MVQPTCTMALGYRKHGVVQPTCTMALGYRKHGVVQPTCTMALGYRKDTNTNFRLDGLLIQLLGGGYEIYSLQIEQSDWTV